MPTKGLADIDCLWLFEKGAAVLIEDEEGTEHWIPSKFVEFDHGREAPERRGHKVVMTIPQWLAEDRGLV